MNFPTWYDEDAPLDEGEQDAPPASAAIAAGRSYFLAAKAQGASDTDASRYAREMVEAIGF